MNQTEKRIEFFYRYCLFFLEAHHRGIKLCPYSFYRSAEEQAKLYHGGKSRRDGYNDRSKHQDWEAIDAFPYEEDAPVWNTNHPHYELLHEIAKKHGLETGHKWTFKDSGHTQLPGFAERRRP